MSSVADKQCQNSWQEVTAQITWIYYFHPFYSSSAVCVRRIKWSAIQLFLFARDCGSSLKETLFEFFPASHSPVSQLLTGQGCLWAGKKMPQMPKLILHSFQRTHSGIWMSLVSHGIHYERLQAITKLFCTHSSYATDRLPLIKHIIGSILEK